jgi:hypothetical protein
MGIAMVTADARAMKQALAKGTPSPIDYGEINKPPEILAEDEKIEVYPLGIGQGDVTIVPVDLMFAD